MLAKFACAALAATLVSAQTHTLCDPTKKDCPNPKALGAKVVDIDFRKGKGDFVKELAGTTLTTDKDLGSVFSIKKDTDAPTVQSDLYIFFGEVSVTLRAAPGVGIVTSVVLQSDDLDEIDWEWVGYDNARVQTNYFSKGCTETYDRGGFSPVSNPTSEFHTYTIKWTRERLDWIIDGTTVRTVLAKDTSGCSLYPQSPMQVKLGTWVGGHPNARPGTIEWAGGLANFANAPFDGYYRSIKVVDYMGGGDAKDATEYQYTDRSGSWQSIKVINDGKAVDNSDKSTSSSATKTSGSGSSTATTFSTASTGSTVPTDTTSSTGGGASGSRTTSSTTSQPPTSGAGKVALTLSNAALIGAALFYLML